MAKVIGIGAATRQDDTIYDPTCGSGSLLLKAADCGMSAQDLDQALTSYARLQAGTARRVLGFHRTRLKGPAAAPGLPASG